MRSEWKEFRLGDITEWASGGTPSKQNADFWNGTIPWISASSMGGNRYNDSDLKITHEGLKSGSRLAKKDSILLLVRGSTLHQRIPVGIATSDVSFNQDVKAIKAKKEFIDPWYLLFWFMAKEKDLLNMVENTGIGAGKLDTNRLQDLLIRIPPEAERDQILLFARALDDKLWLNRQINQTLESMAKAIFKSWFVDFEPVKAKIAAIEAGEDAEGVTCAAMSAISGKKDEELDQLQAKDPECYIQLKTTAELFPAAMQDSELGEIPEGWESKAFSTVIDVNPVRRLPKGKLATKVSMADLNTWQSWIDSWQKEEYKSGPKFKNGDNLFARITPSLENGKTAFVNFLSAGETAFGSTEFIVFGPKIIASGSYIFCLSRSKHIRETAINAMTGTSGRQRVPNNCFDHLLICVPSDKIVGKFNEITVSLFKMIEHNSKESIHLKKARDSLLPKLLAGELSVETAEFVGGN